MSDDAGSTFDADIRSYINTGDWFRKPGSTEIGYEKKWVIANSFKALRVVNKIIEKVPNMSAISQEQKNELLGQAYFLRAWHYFEIIRRWGGMPKFDKVYAPDDDLDMERLTYHESTEWLITDLNRAFDLLPERWPEAELGRATKGAAKALKSMAALYAASPLMSNDLNTVANTGYDEQWSKDAAQYASETLNYIESYLPTRKMQGENWATVEERDSLYRHIFYHSPDFVSDEALWFNNATGSNREVDISILFWNIRFSGRPGNYGWTITSPSQNLVDRFEVINPNDGQAYPIDHPNSGYLSDDPYNNRDPRFYNNILYAGRQWGLDQQNNPFYFEPWEGGADHHSNWARSVPTGYMCVKWAWPDAKFKSDAYQNYTFSCSYIRTTQIVLDYAEAMNEAYGPNSDPQGYGMTAVEAINRVRARVGMPEVLGEYTSTKEAFRKRIRNERSVELMFESHRWFDIRRWMTAEDLFSESTPIYGMQVTD